MIQTVIYDTKTVAEYKLQQETMLKLAEEYSAKHMAAVPDWSHGEPIKVWYDHRGDVCIDYTDGTYWHYDKDGNWYIPTEW